MIFMCDYELYDIALGSVYEVLLYVCMHCHSIDGQTLLAYILALMTLHLFIKV